MSLKRCFHLFKQIFFDERQCFLGFFVQGNPDNLLDIDNAQVDVNIF
jgi:hypothetical protein